jgi:hypothetical protein
MPRCVSQIQPSPQIGRLPSNLYRAVAVLSEAIDRGMPLAGLYDGPQMDQVERQWKASNVGADKVKHVAESSAPFAPPLRCVYEELSDHPPSGTKPRSSEFSDYVRHPTHNRRREDEATEGSIGALASKAAPAVLLGRRAREPGAGHGRLW